MSDHESVNPLFNKMDALMARHRGARAEEDALPVLTEEAAVDALEDDIPVLTLEAAPEPSALMFDPREFLSPQTHTVVPRKAEIPLVDARPRQPEFLDLPLLDLESLLDIPAPFGRAPVQPSHAKAPNQPGLAAETTAVPTAEHTALQWDGVPPVITEVIIDAVAFEHATEADATHYTDLQWEDAPTPPDSAWAHAVDHATAELALQDDDDIPVLLTAVIEDAPDWEPVSPWWDNAAADAAVSAAIIAESASQGFIADTPVAPAVATLVEDPLALDEAVFTVEFSFEPEAILVVDLDQWHQEDTHHDLPALLEGVEIGELEAIHANEVQAEVHELTALPVLEIEAPPEPLEMDIVAEALPVLDEAVVAKPDTAEPVIEHASEPVAEDHVLVVEIDISAPAAQDLTEATDAYVDQDELPHAVAHTEVTEPVSAPEALVVDTEATLPLAPVTWQVEVLHEPGPVEAETEPVAIVTEVAEMVPEATPAATPAPAASTHGMDDYAIAEVTAGVAAHLAVDISTEVERLTRQHFASMMQALYGEAMTALVDKINNELEARLAPRIDELVREELKRRGLLP